MIFPFEKVQNLNFSTWNSERTVTVNAFRTSASMSECSDSKVSNCQQVSRVAESVTELQFELLWMLVFSFRNSKQKKSNLNFEFQRISKNFKELAKVWPLIGKNVNKKRSCGFSERLNVGLGTRVCWFVADQNFTRKSWPSVRGLCVFVSQLKV